MSEATALSEAAQKLLVDVVERRREAIVDRAAAWVIEGSPDLGPDRPLDTTRRLVAGVVASQMAALGGDDRPLAEFIDYVTALRASSEFHVSTLLRGMLSFRRALEGELRASRCDGWAALDVLAAVDAIAQDAVFRSADAYFDKLHATLLDRRRELEEELRFLASERERELDERARTIEEQRRLLSALSSPVIRVWEGVIVVPVIGELDAGRAADMQEKVLGEVVATRSRMVLIDVTGMANADEESASGLVRLLRATRFIGAAAAVIGVSPAAAMALSSLDLALSEIRAFATLHDALRAVLEAEARRPRARR